MNPIDADLCPKCGNSLAKHSYFTQQAGVLFMCPPALELPTEPTWGIVLSKHPDRHDQHIADIGRWAVYGDEGWSPLERTHRSPVDTRCDVLSRQNIAAFIPLTAEQVRQIEAAQ